MPDVDPSVAVWVATIAAISSIVTTYIQVRFGRRLGEVHEQVKNTHSTNLRQDIDEIKSEVRRQGREIAELRADMRVDRLVYTSFRYPTAYGRAPVPPPSEK